MAEVSFHSGVRGTRSRQTHDGERTAFWKEGLRRRRRAFAYPFKFRRICVQERKVWKDSGDFMYALVKRHVRLID